MEANFICHTKISPNYVQRWPQNHVSSRYCWEQTESDDHQGGNNPRTFVRKLGSKLDESVAAGLEKALGAEKNICIDQTPKGQQNGEVHVQVSLMS